MPLPFAWLVAFALGAGFARVAQGEIARSEGPLVLSRPMAVVLGFAAFVMLPVAGYFAAFHGDWAYLYAVNWQHVPSAVDLALALGAAALVPAGFATAVPAIRAKQTRAVQALVGGPLAACALMALIFAKRLAMSASHAQYAGGYGVEELRSSALGKGVLWAWVALAAGAAWTWRQLRTA